MTSPHPHPDQQQSVSIEPDYKASAAYLMERLVEQLEQTATREGALQALHRQKQIVERELEAAVMTVGQLRAELSQSREAVTHPRPDVLG